MALDPARLGNFSLANVLPFPRKPAAPQFAGTLPPIQSTCQIALEGKHFDIFQSSRPNTARIVLRPAESLQDEITASLSNQLLKVQADLKGGSGPLASLETVAGTLASLIGGKTVDPQGNLFATYRAKQLKRTKAGDDENKKAQAEKRAEKRAEIGTQNIGILVNAVKAKLEALPANIKEVTIDLPRRLPEGVEQAALVRELAETVTLSGYNFNFHKEYNRPTNRLERIVIAKSGLSRQETARAVAEGQAVGEAMNLTRHFVDSPANLKKTRYIADTARGLQSATLKVDVLERDDLEGKTAKNDKRMGLLLGVGQGNDKSDPDRDPRLVEMVYTPADWDPQTGRTVMLVGKGIIFDTGGNNLKTSEYIHNMEGDMAGAAAVIGTMQALDKLQLSGVRVIGLAPLTENRLGSGATLPNDILVSRAGKTVQVSNTDAEGRLILADAIHYGVEKYKPDAVADIATLTGGKVRGVGAQNAVAISGNNPDLMKQVDKLEKQMRRTSAVLPLTQNHHNWVTRAGKGKADVFNSVSSEEAMIHGVLPRNFVDPRAPMLQHSAQGAAFLREFFPKGSEKTPWVHYDMAGAEFDKPDPKTGETWATGFGVKELFYFVKGLAEGGLKADAEKSEVVKRR